MKRGRGMQGREERSKGIEIHIADVFDIIKPTTPFEVVFIFSRIKKDEDQGKEKCHSKSMMSNEANVRLKRDTQHVPLRQNAEEKVRGIFLLFVCCLFSAE